MVDIERTASYSLTGIIFTIHLVVAGLCKTGCELVRTKNIIKLGLAHQCNRVLDENRYNYCNVILLGKEDGLNGGQFLFLKPIFFFVSFL